jgi:membrane protease YdiL (CAAX protease family)
MDSNSGLPEAGAEPATVVAPELQFSAPISAPVDQPPLVRFNPHAENPPWTGIDLLIAAVAFVVAVFIASVVFLSIAVHVGGVSATELAKNPTAAIIVPAMTFGYIVMLAVFYARVTSAQGLPFWKAIQWHWPQGYSWLAWLAAGGTLTIALGLLSRLLPFPKSLPMERFFRDPQAVYLMMFLGVAVAPLTEEISFRGFLYPLLDRGLQTMFMVRRQLLDAGKWLVLMAAWGFSLHLLAGWSGMDHQAARVSSLLAGLLMFLVVGILFFGRWLLGKPADTLLLSGLGLCFWGLMARSISDRAFGFTTLVLLGVAVVLGGVAVAGALSPSVASWLGRILAVLATSVAFAMIHSEQLGDAWGPLLVIFIVGLVLTITRVKTRSLAPGFLIHMAYNLTLFIGLYFGSDHLRHLERVSQ